MTSKFSDVRLLLAPIFVGVVLFFFWYPRVPVQAQQKPTEILAGPPIQHRPSAAQLSINVSDRMEVGPDRKVSFSVLADSAFPEEPSKGVTVNVYTEPWFPLEKDPPQNQIDGKRLWKYRATIDQPSTNLVKITARLCAKPNCDGAPLDKSEERVIDVGATPFEEAVSVKLHPDDNLVAGSAVPVAFVDLENNGHFIAPTSNIIVRLDSLYNCVQFGPERDKHPSANSIDLHINAAKHMRQTESFSMLPSSLSGQSCAMEATLYDDGGQRSTPTTITLALGTSLRMSVGMCFAGGALALALVIWRRAYRKILPYFSWMDFFEYVIKSSLSAVISLVLTTHDLVGITVDKSSPKGFFTFGFLLGFIPLNDIIDSIMQKFGINQPPTSVPPPVQPSSVQPDPSVQPPLTGASPQP
jgi:hypothetical protein